MTSNLKITFHGLSHSDAVVEHVRRRAEKLDTFFDRLTSCSVAIEAPHRHKHKGSSFHVRIQLGVPKANLVISHGDDGAATADAHVAIDAAFDDAERRLRDHASRQRSDARSIRTGEAADEGD